MTPAAALPNAKKKEESMVRPPKGRAWRRSNTLRHSGAAQRNPESRASMLENDASPAEHRTWQGDWIKACELDSGFRFAAPE
jgi:hypothetical protein